MGQREVFSKTDGVLVRQIRIRFVFLDFSREVVILEAAARIELAHKGFPYHQEALYFAFQGPFSIFHERIFLSVEIPFFGEERIPSKGRAEGVPEGAADREEG